MRKTLTHRPLWRLALPFGLLALIAGGLPTLLISNSIATVYAEGGWSTPVSLSIPIPPTFYTASPAVGINSLGAQAAAWINEDNYLLLQVAARDAGGSWTSGQTLTPRSGDNAAEPAVAVSPSGTAVAIWDLYNVSQGGVVIQTASRPAHGSWSPVVTLTPAADSSSHPQIGMDANGNALAIWLHTTSTNGGIFAANLPAGSSWSTPVQISTVNVSAQNPVLAVNASGDAVAGWQTANGIIYVAERHSGVWSAPIIIAPAAFRQGSPHVAIGDRGDAAAAWSGRGTTLAATRAAGGMWSVPTTLSKSSGGGTARVALDQFGNAVVVFDLVQYVGGSGYAYPLQAASHPAGGSWGTPVTISGANETAATVNLVATPAGTFVAGWVNGASVKAAIRAIGHSTFGSPAVVGSGDSLELAVAAGKTAATWVGPGPSVQVSDNNVP